MTKLWVEFFIVLGAGAGLLVCAAFILQHFTPSATWRRIVWQACFVALGLLWCCELTGARSAATTLLSRRPDAAAPPESKTTKPSPSPMTLTVLPPVPAQAAPSNTISRSVPAGTRPNPLQLWWPGVVWVGGVIILALLAAGRRILLLTFRRRCGSVNDATVLAQIESLARQLGIRRRVHVVNSVRLISPIAFGVLRPTICLPTSFTELFGPPEQEAILMHELAHIAARDSLWQCFASILTTLFWWHPLVWWAQRELRCASEAAADEVSLMLANGPKVLAECLVNLGTRFTDSAGFKALGIQGVRFRSGLGRRVQRLFLLSNEETEFAPPTVWRSRSAQFLAPTICVALILGCSAWAGTTKKGQTMRNWKQSLAGLAAASLLHTLQVGADPVTKPSDAVKIAATKSQNTSESESAVSRLQKPPIAATNTSIPKLSDLNATSRNAQLMRSKLENIVLDHVTFDGLPLAEVVKNLIDESTRRDPEKHGVNFIFANPRFELVPAIDPATGLPVTGAGAVPEPVDLRSTTIRIVPPVRNIRLIDLLEVIRRVADRPIEYTIHEYGVVLTAAPPLGAQVNIEPMTATEARTFKVDPKNFFLAVKKTFGVEIGTRSSDETRMGLAQFLATLGVDIHSANRAVFYNDLTGTLLVRASADEMNLIIAAMETLGANGPVNSSK